MDCSTAPPVAAPFLASSLPPSPPLRHEDAPLTFGKIVCRAKNDDYAGRRGEGEGNYMGHFMLDLRPLYCHELSIFALH